MNIISATIITIGDELLIGQVLDTNSAFIAQELNKIGVVVKHRIAVGDNKQDIIDALDFYSLKSNIVILTGGLGPTADDITKPLLCSYFDGELQLHQPTLKHIEYLFEQIFKRPLPLLERNRKQAEVPSTCIVLKNEVGTAPGMQFTKNGVYYFSLPGVPAEMKLLVKNHVISAIRQNFSLGYIIHKTLLAANIGESVLAERLINFEAKLPTNIKLAYLPNYSLVRLRLTGFGKNESILENELELLFSEMQHLVADVMITNKDEAMQDVIARLLTQNNETLSTAESCTGGYIAHLLTQKSGASNYYKGSVISYDNNVKQNILHVSEQVLATVGAVSKETVEQMAITSRAILQTDYSIAVSGIMGPNGGTKEKPVGTVWIAVASSTQVKTKKFVFRWDRERNMMVTAVNAFILLRELIVDKP
jgi:nicotinamide-nucleotide amidase